MRFEMFWYDLILEWFSALVPETVANEIHKLLHGSKNYFFKWSLR